MKQVAAIIMVALVVTACGDSGEAENVSSACAGPIIAVSPASVSPEGTIVVTGEGFFEGGCDDVGEVRDGETVFEELPQTGVVVTASSGSQEWELGAIDVDGDGSFTLEVDLPADVSEGKFTVKAGDAEPAAASIARD